MQDNDRADILMPASRPLLEVRTCLSALSDGSGEPGPAVLDDVSLTLKGNEIVGLTGALGLRQILAPAHRRPGSFSPPAAR